MISLICAIEMLGSLTFTSSFRVFLLIFTISFNCTYLKYEVKGYKSSANYSHERRLMPDPSKNETKSCAFAVAGMHWGALHRRG